MYGSHIQANHKNIPRHNNGVKSLHHLLSNHVPNLHVGGHALALNLITVTIWSHTCQCY